LIGRGGGVGGSKADDADMIWLGDTLIVSSNGVGGRSRSGRFHNPIL
jgi:hypothetical protein